ncbi:hypothetical protein [Levilactobacillus tujiorum]|uniref:hypothetical protein n=1 Tax=Levilactobacillus tujiorum TaxID=2912243 RepID=UPI001457957F|nr:hypothetical protein [Levilactobacillus tujiorum]NLR31738.1 hypothetical protein [Levilactobacillus tujiorum]
MKVKWLDIYLATIALALAALIVTSRSSVALTSGFFGMGAKAFEALLIIVPIVVGSLRPISLRTLLAYSLLFLLAIITWIESKDMAIFQIICLAFGLRKIDFQKIAVTFFSGLSLGTIVIFLGAIFGKFNSVITTRTTGDANNLIKTSLGFLLPNTAGLVLLAMLITALYIFNFSGKFRRQLCLFICTLPILYLIYRTGARTSLILAIITYTVWVLLSRRKIAEFMLNHMVTVVVSIAVGVFIFSYGTALFYENSSSDWLLNLDRLTTGRLSLSSRALSEYGTTLVGQHVTSNVVGLGGLQSYFWIDNSYIRILVNEGIVWGGILLWGIYIATKRAKLAGNVMFVMPMIVMLILGYSESSLLYFWFDFMLFSIDASFPQK